MQRLDVFRMPSSPGRQYGDPEGCGGERDPPPGKQCALLRTSKLLFISLLSPLFALLAKRRCWPPSARHSRHPDSASASLL